MPLAQGDKIGPYEIVDLLGAGGMGEVYRARDTKLDRDVAIKVLPAALAQDSERLARFEREAKVLASLNHPNIAQIYGLEQRALVMELVEGETLKGPLPIATALNYAKQIADALEAAHEKGITHRDLKPANIMITPAGVVKVLDFGLAAVAQDPVYSTDPSNSPTLTMRATQAGMILGTAAYMSPEQASGKPVDKRADIWSFGAVLYEMLTGKRAFGGESVADTLATVMKLDPDWSPLPRDAPASIHNLVRRCLTKDRKQRLQAIGEARIVLENPISPVAPAGLPPVTAPWRSRLSWVSATVLAAALAAVSFLHFREQPPAERTLRYTITAPENSTVHSFAISPDGGQLAVAAAVNGKRQLWLRPLDALQAQLMPGTEGAIYPFWSPDSRYIGFFAQGKLKKIAASGGSPQSLCDATDGRGGSWNREDVIVFSPSGKGGRAIQRVPAAGGVPTDVTRTKGTYRFPVFLPDGRRFLYLVSPPSPEGNGVYLGSLDGKDNRRVLADNSSVVLGAGHVLFIRENTLMAQPFDATNGQVSGDVLPVAEGVSLGVNVNFAPLSASENGVLIYPAAGLFSPSQIVWFDRAGKFLSPVGVPGRVFMPSISPDEKTIAFIRRTDAGTDDIWLRDLDRGTDVRFTSGSQNGAPFWSPKGDRMVFVSIRGGRLDLYQKAASGSGPDELLYSTTNDKWPDQWSRDGRFIVYSENDPKTRHDLWVLSVGDRKPTPFLQTEFNEFEGQLSPDSHWMAYTSDESGQREVYVRPFPAADGKWRISIAGGEQPRWRGDGKELFFVAADGKMTAVAVRAAAGPKPSFQPGAPLPLFDTHMAAAGGTSEFFRYDVTSDGRRFLVDTTGAAGAASSPPLTVVVNWKAGLKK